MSKQMQSKQNKPKFKVLSMLSLLYINGTKLNYSKTQQYKVALRMVFLMPFTVFIFDVLISNEFYKIWTCFKLQAQTVPYVKEVWKKISDTLNGC